MLPGYNVRPLEMSGAIGIEQLEKLPDFIDMRRTNAKHFESIFEGHPFVAIQKELGESSWFGFALILKPTCSISRNNLVNALAQHQIECRPIVTGNFVKNQKALSYFDYEVSGPLENADYIDDHGFFVGNQQVDLTEELDYFNSILSELIG